MESALVELAEEGQPTDEISVLVRLRPDGYVPSQIRVIARFGLIATCRLMRGNIELVRAQVDSMKCPKELTPSLDLDDWDDDASGDLDPRPGDVRRAPGLPTGVGVIVAHVDWGLDFCHRAFRRADGTTRLLALWDQGAVYDPAYPNRYGFGRIHLRADIDRALAAHDPYAALGYRWWTSDRGSGSHGTHTLGISGGGGLDGGEPGMAPEADLIFVDLTTRTPEGPKPLGDSTDLAEGCDFAVRTAGDRPLVISASLGRMAGEHDGWTLTEQLFDAMLAERPGRAMTMSCGNYYAKNAHAHVALDPGERHDFGLILGEGRRAAEVDLWYPRADRIELAVSGPDGIASGWVGPDARAELTYRGQIVAKLYNRTNDPNNGDSQGSLFIRAGAPAGRWTLSVHGVSIGDGRVHAWIERDPAGAGRLRFDAAQVDPQGTIGTICNGFRTIAVAAYDAHAPGRPPGRFSSAGPTRDGRTNRPGCAAPGVQVISARSRPRDGRAAPPTTRMSGTSMATPYVAGTVALMFAAAPRPLTIDETREILIGSCEPVGDELRLRFGAGFCAPVTAVARAAAIDTPSPPQAARPAGPPSHRPATAEEHDMTEDEEFADTGDCAADSDAEWAAQEAAAEGWDSAAFADDSEARGRDRDRGFGPLPFQFQIPIGGGGGGLGLAVPIGGRSSPFALSVPLGSPPPPPQVVMPVVPAALAAPATPAAPATVTTALDLPEPDFLAAATLDAAAFGEFGESEDEACCADCAGDNAEDEAETQAAYAEALAIDQLERGYQRADYAEVDARYAGEQVMAAVAGTGGSWPSSSGMLANLGEALGSGEASEGADSPTVSLHDLFRQVADGGATPPRLFGRAARILLRPGEPIGSVAPMRGDVLLRAVPGHGWVQLSFVATPGLLPGARLAALGYRPEEDPAHLPGRYVHIAELWPLRRDEDDRFARRLANAADLVPHDTILLRLAPEGGFAEAEAADYEDDAASGPTLTPGAHGTVVADLQRRLNALHAARMTAGLSGLGDMPLAVDGAYGPRLRAAVVGLQRLAPAGMNVQPDGVVAGATWRVLALLEAAVALVSTPAAPASPRQPAPRQTGAGIAAGQVIVPHLPLLAGHIGTAPDLVLRWNAMPAAPERVDVVVHLHGFSGRAEAMRIDRDKLPNSGLDFTSPGDPSVAGRTAPTLGILPRGNFYGGRSHAGYDFPALVAPGALARLVAQSLERFAAANNLASVTAGRLILTAHSGGGAPLMRLLGEYDPDEVYTFDALYGAPDALIRWAEAKLRGPAAHNAALRVIFRDDPHGTGEHSRQVAHALARLAAADPATARRFRAEQTRESHNGIPRRYGWRLLADGGSELDGPAPAAAPAQGEYEYDYASGEDDPVATVDQATVTALGAREFGTAGELQAYFAQSGGFAAWFNRTLGGRAPFVRTTGGGALRMPTGATAIAQFNGFWDRLSLAYAQPRISLLEFAALMAIVLNETDGNFRSATERAGRGRTDANGPHPGLAYFFDAIDPHPGNPKASYNHMSGGRTAGSLFDDPVFVRAHGTLGGADRLANQGTMLDGVWNGRAYPQQAFSTSETAADTAFIREADFCKFRGRGMIQTTGRDSYRKHVHYIRGYRGSDPVIRGLAARWASAQTDDEVCTISTNAEWEQWFALPDTIALGLFFHAGAHGYQHMSRDAAVLNALVPLAHGRAARGTDGAIATMGRRISGGRRYGNGIYRDRVIALMQALAQLVAAAPSAPTPQPTSQSTSHAEAAESVPHRTAVAAPDEATARAQWDAHPRAHGYFPHGVEEYVGFAPAFAQRGVGDAAAYLANNMTRLTFFGRHQDGHRDLAAPLRAAEEALRGHDLQPALTSFGCLNVRFIAGTHRLSFHGLGRAVDLNPGTNPHIKAAADFLVIQAVTGADLRREHDPRRLRELSAQFQRDFTDGWIAQHSDPAIVAALHQDGALRRLRRYAHSGFCTLDLALIEALRAAGLNWGGSWTHSKDFMHFELA